MAEVGELFRNPEFAAVLEGMCEAERKAAGGGRIAGIEAASAEFYRGPVAERIVEFISSNPVEDASGEAHAGLLDYDDIADWEATVEDPVSIEYEGLRVHKCPAWTQGPTFLQHLRILDGFDLAGMRHNTADYLHTWVEAAKLSFADREAYYGDPLFDDVPFDMLLSEEYAEQRRGLIGDTASFEMRPGDVGRGAPQYATTAVSEDNRRSLGLPVDVSSTWDWGTPTRATRPTSMPWTVWATWWPQPQVVDGSARHPLSRASGSPSGPGARCSTSTRTDPMRSSPGNALGPR